MLVNRDNWYMSPINEWGRPRQELFSVFQGLVQTFKRMKPHLLEKLTSISVTINPIQYAARTIPQEFKILTAFYEADIDYELFNPEITTAKNPIVFYSGNQWLNRKAQMNLRNYVENGGILVAFRHFPRKDDNFEPCNILGFEEPSRTLFEFRRTFTLILDKIKIEQNSSVYSFDTISGRPIQADFGNYGIHTIGYQKKVGKGSIFHLGIVPTKELILAVLNYFKVPVYSNSQTKDVKTAMFKRNGHYYLIAVNNGNEDKSANILLHFPIGKVKRAITTDLLTQKSEEYIFNQRPSVHLDIPRKDGKVIEIRVK